MAEWKPVQEIILVVWQEAEAPEEGEKPPTTEAEAQIRARTLVFAFKSEQEAIAFIGDEVREKIKLNQDGIPPNVFRQINQTLDAGDTIMALNQWLEAVGEYFDEPEAVDMRKVPMMVKE